MQSLKKNIHNWFRSFEYESRTNDSKENEFVALSIVNHPFSPCHEVRVAISYRKMWCWFGFIIRKKKIRCLTFFWSLWWISHFRIFER